MDQTPEQLAQSSNPQPILNQEQSIQGEKKVSKSMFGFLIFLGVVVLACIGSGTYYLGMQKNIMMHKQQSIAETTPTPTPDPTANWQTYTNTTYGYAVKYPASVETNEQNTNYHYVEFKTVQGTGMLPPFLISVIPDTFVAKDMAAYNYMSSDWINTFYSMKVGESKTTSSGAVFTKSASTTVDKQAAIVVDVVATGFKQKRVYVKNNGFIYMIANYYQSPDELPNFQPFLSTFTFVKITTDTANWQVYQAHGFSLKYPTTWTYKEYASQPASTFFYDPSTASHTGNGGSILYGSNLMVVRIPSSTGQTVKNYIDTIQAQQIPALASDFQRKTIVLNSVSLEVYHIGGEGSVGWYIPFSRGNGFDVFGPLTTDPTQDSIELQIVKTFKITQ